MDPILTLVGTVLFVCPKCHKKSIRVTAKFKPVQVEQLDYNTLNTTTNTVDIVTKTMYKTFLKIEDLDPKNQTCPYCSDAVEYARDVLKKE